MALINKDSMKEINKERNTVHCKVKSTITKFELEGIKYFQLDTYGKNSRVEKDKISQSIQIDEDTAIELVNMLANYFEF